MQTVQELVKSKSEERRLAIQQENERQEKQAKKEMSKQFSKEIKTFIWEFERRYFNVNSKKNDVAECILSAERYDRNYVTGDSYEAVVFSDEEKYGKKRATRSPIFNKWKKALEDKFGLKLRFYEYERTERRFGSSGFETYPNYIYEGICVVFGFKNKK